ncbi:MAG: NUDIX domain-containing protein [Chloroflexi bacterium]|nr:NUDIX domain-containing protein [Chloroflexota bacterium]
MIREFTVAVFVVHDGKVLLHWHRKLQRWLPPGGHIEPGELPDDTALRETLEEAGLEIELLDAALPPAKVIESQAGSDEPCPRRLTQPLGIQLEDIAPGHQHIDLIYVARPCTGAPPAVRAAAGDPESRPGWFAPGELRAIGVTTEVSAWAEAAVHAARA